MDAPKQEIGCPECGQRLNVPKAYIGLAGCPVCMNKIDVGARLKDEAWEEDVDLGNNLLRTFLSPFSASLKLLLVYIATMVGLVVAAVGNGHPILGSNYSVLYFYAGILITVAYLVLAVLAYIFDRKTM